MVLNKRALERAFSPGKRRKQVGHARNLGRTVRAGNTEISSSMRVVVRTRPENPKELENNYRCVVKEIDDKTLVFDPIEELEPFFFHGTKQKDVLKKQNKELPFEFDRVFDRESSNEEVFEGTTKDIVKSLLNGYNCSVFAYGATGAGKTFTMLGSKDSPGITYLTMVELYRQLEALKDDKEFELAVSHLEVYNENVQDLIQPSGPLHLREDSNVGVRIPGLSIHRINNADELFTLMEQGNKNRTQHPTDANAESSRSHSVFQLYVRMTSKLDRSMKFMKLSMIDLAGSERGSATGCKGMRFTEGANINRSLLALGNCINSLAAGLKHIPYRDSKLTRLLKDSLGGNCQTVMIANISPSSLSYEDTYNTLKYAARARKIKQTGEYVVTAYESDDDCDGSSGRGGQIREQQSPEATPTSTYSKMKQNVISVQLHASQYEKMVEELSAEVQRLKSKLREYEEQQTRMSHEEDAELRAHFEDMSNVKKEIFKLGREIKLVKFRSHRKRRIADRISRLCVSPSVLNQQVGKVRATLEQFRGRIASLQETLTAAFDKWNECAARTEQLMKQKSEAFTFQITTSQLQEKVADRDAELQHCRCLIAMQHSELENQELVIKDLCESLKEYHSLLKAHNFTTESMTSNFENLVGKLEGARSVSWKADDTMENIANLNIESLRSLQKDTEDTSPDECVTRLLKKTSKSSSDKENSLNSTFVLPVPALKENAFPATSKIASHLKMKTGKPDTKLQRPRPLMPRYSGINVANTAIKQGPGRGLFIKPKTPSSRMHPYRVESTTVKGRPGQLRN